MVYVDEQAEVKGTEVRVKLGLVHREPVLLRGRLPGVLSCVWGDPRR